MAKTPDITRFSVHHSIFPKTPFLKNTMFRGKVTVPEKGKITVPGYCPIFDPISSHTLPLSPDPSPPPGGYRGCCKVATITARIPAKSQKRNTVAPHLAPIS